MERIKPRTLSGFMELLPGEQALFDRMAALLRESYALYGFTPLDTPLLESSEVSGPSGAGSGNSTRRTSTSSETAAWTSSMRPRSRLSSTTPSPPWA